MKSLAHKITIVAGSPGSGKSTYVRNKARWGDLILDFDELFIALSGLPAYEKPVGLIGFVCEARDAIMRKLQARNFDGHAWIVTGESSKRKLRAMKSDLDARLIVMDTNEGECLRRIAKDERRKSKVDLWRPIVRKWWQAFNAED